MHKLNEYIYLYSNKDKDSITKQDIYGNNAITLAKTFVHSSLAEEHINSAQISHNTIKQFASGCKILNNATLGQCGNISSVTKPVGARGVAALVLRCTFIHA